MSIIFKINNPITLKSGTGVTLSEGVIGFTEKDFDGSNSANVKVAIGQPIGTSDNVQFDSVTLTSGDSLNVGGFVISDGTISGSRVRFQQDLEVTQNLRVTSSLVVNGTITSGSGTFGSTSKTTTHNTGSTRWGESLTQKQFATGSFEISSSFFLNGYEINEISNDTDLTDQSPKAFVTENVTKSHLATIKPDRDYLRKSFVHTGSFVNSATSSFTAITASSPTSMTSTSENDFMFFINGMVMENDALTIEQKGSTNLELRIDTDALGYILDSSDEVIGFGKFNS
tara:strand:- start:1106 stop:1960 length:855 start_codon:yes stop_codon:yes gene_type:complete